MDAKAQKLRAKTEKAEAEFREARRKEREHAREEAEKERKRDARRKIIDGAHQQKRALTNPLIAAMLQEDRENNLDDDIDRALFGLPPLSDDEKARRVAMRNAGASSAPPDSYEEAPALNSDLRLVVGN